MESGYLNGSRWWVTPNYNSTRKFSISYLAKGASRMSKHDIVTYREGAPHYEAYTTETGKVIPQFVAKALWEFINQ